MSALYCSFFHIESVPLFGIVKERRALPSSHTLPDILDLTYLPLRPPLDCCLFSLFSAFFREDELIPVKLVYDYCEVSAFQRDPKCIIKLYLHTL
jgi:hypothetical protein